MALFKNQQLGKVKGRLGDTIFKERKGTSYVASPATIFHKSNAPQCVRSRTVFGLNNKLFSALGNIFVLKSLWIEAPISKGTFINKMQKVNKGMVGDDYDFTKIKMAPFEQLFKIELDSYELGINKLKIKIAPPELTRDMIGQAKCSVQGAIHIVLLDHDILGKTTEVDKFFPAQSGDITYTESGPMEFDLRMNEADYTQIEGALRKKFYAFMLVKNASGRPYRASETVSGTL